MLKKAAALAFAAGLLIPAISFAQTTDVTSQIAALLSEIQQLEQEIAQLKGGSATCVNLPNDLTLGATGSDVTNLQNYLIAKGDLDAQYNTGYYGYLTAGAVGKLQLSLGLVSSANDSAYGIVGPQTRSAIACSNSSTTITSPAQPQSPNGVSFDASPTSGFAPLTVDFTVSRSAGSDSVTFGDGQMSSMARIAETDGSDPNMYFNHSYAQAGTYTATLDDSSGNVLGTQTITVASGQTSSAPTCMITPAVTFANPGQSITVSWSSQNAVSAFWLAGDTASTNGSKTFQTDPNSTNYTWDQALVVENSAGVQGKCSVSVPIGGSIAGSATIDQGAFTTSSGTPTISGSASGVSSVYVAITNGTNQAGTANQTGTSQGQVSVVNGRWSTTIYPKGESTFTAGTYTISVYTAPGGTLLTSGTLSILGNALQPTASIDQSSLSIASGNPTITGTANNVASVFVVIADANGTQEGTSQGAVPVVNGHWNSGPVYAKGSGSSFPAGTYTVTVENGLNGPILDIGTLTVNSVPTCSLTADRTSVIPGQYVTLTWTSQNATSASWLAGDSVGLTGSETRLIPSNITGANWDEVLIVQSGGQQGRCGVSLPINYI